MNNIFKSFALASLLITACHAGNNESKHEQTPAEKSEPKFAGVQFASLKDTSCGMTLGDIADTVMMDGKVYGFCSAECKGEFVTTLETENKR